jgi:hypothetical protein
MSLLWQNSHLVKLALAYKDGNTGGELAGTPTLHIASNVIQ